MKRNKTISMESEHVELLKRLAEEQDREQGVIVGLALEHYEEVSR